MSSAHAVYVKWCQMWVCFTGRWSGGGRWRGDEHPDPLQIWGGLHLPATWRPQWALCSQTQGQCHSLISSMWKRLCLYVCSVSLKCVTHPERAQSAHSHTRMCAPGPMLQVLAHTLAYPLKRTYAHIHTHKVKQLSWSHNQTVESCWGTLNRKECSLLS